MEINKKYKVKSILKNKFSKIKDGADEVIIELPRCSSNYIQETEIPMQRNGNDTKHSHVTDDAFIIIQDQKL